MTSIGGREAREGMAGLVRRVEVTAGPRWTSGTCYG